MALIHVGSLVKRLLSQHFGDRDLPSHFPFSWLTRSPNLTPMDFWLRGFVKSKVFYPQTVSVLKDVIRTAIQEIPIAVASAVLLSIICRMQSVILCEGGHVANLWNTIKFCILCFFSVVLGCPHFSSI